MNKINRERRVIFLLAFTFTLLGLLMVYEASSIYAWKTKHDYGYFFKKQLIFFLLSIPIFVGMLSIDLESIKKYAFCLLLFNIFLLVLVLVLGKKVGGARRWLSIGGINLQPSELLKVTYLVWSVDYLNRKGALIRNLKEGIFPLFLVTGIVFLLILLEPDLGTPLFWILWLYLMLLIFKAKKRHLLSFLLLGVVLAGVLIKVHPYRFHRIVAYLNPWKDPKGSGFQLIQSQIAYGRGGVLGVGLGESRQKLLFLPAAHTDFIFSIIAEEFGFVGSSLILAMFFVFIFKIFKLGFFIHQTFRRNLCFGIGLILALEILINVGVSCGLFPTKGLPLPFVSYGGTSLVVHYALLGLLFNASRELGNSVARGV